MRITAALLIALFAIIGTTSAINIEITSPTDGATFTADDKVLIRSHVIDNDGNSDFRVRTFINGVLNKNSNWPAPNVDVETDFLINCTIFMLDENYIPTGETFSDEVTIKVFPKNDEINP